MRSITIGTLLLICGQGQDENPLLPKYPFKGAKITYKPGPVQRGTEKLQIEGVAYIRGRCAYLKTRILDGKNLREESVRFTDGTYVYDVEIEKGKAGTKKTATRGLHYGAYLRAECAEMTPEERKKFDAALEAFWNEYSPVFNLTFEDGKVKPKVEGSAPICGRDCEIFSLDLGGTKMKYWRMKGTDIVLKFEGPGSALEADKIEENVDVPEDLFERPEEATEDQTQGVFDRDRAAAIFKRLAGRPAKRVDTAAAAAKASGLTFGGKTVPLAKFQFEWFSEEGTGQVRIVSEKSPWRFELFVQVKAKKLQDLAGKTVKLGDDAHYAALTDGKVVYGSKGTLKVVSVKNDALVIQISGPWRSKGVDEEGDGKEAGSPEIEIRAVPLQ